MEILAIPNIIVEIKSTINGQSQMDMTGKGVNEMKRQNNITVQSLLSRLEGGYEQARFRVGSQYMVNIHFPP